MEIEKVWQSVSERVKVCCEKEEAALIATAMTVRDVIVEGLVTSEDSVTL